MSKKIYGIESQTFEKLKDAKKYARFFYGPNADYVLHFGIKSKEGDESFNEGKKFNTGLWY